MIRGFRFTFVILILLGTSHGFAQGNALISDSDTYVLGPGVFHNPQDFTIETWVNPSAFPRFAFLFYIGRGDSNGFGMSLHDGVGPWAGPYVSLFIYGSAYSATGNSLRLPVNTWTHIALTHTDTTWQFYKNGELVGHCTSRMRSPSAFTYLPVFFKGLSDEYRFWNKRLTVEEIRSSMYTTLNGTETGLVAYYNMDTLGASTGARVPNRCRATGRTYDLTMYGLDVGFVPSSLPVTGTAPISLFEELPKHMQFFARRSAGPGRTKTFGYFTISGTVFGSYDSVLLEMWRNDTVIYRHYHPFMGGGPTNRFSFNDSIPSELSQFTVRMYAMRGDSLFFLREAADLVAGDCYMISGQSNSHPSHGAVLYMNPFLRSFGVQTPNTNYYPYNPADTTFGMSNAHGFGNFFGGPFLTGVWGERLQELISNRYQIPIFVINGGAGASSILQNLRNDKNHQDLDTVYGRALYRNKKAGLDTAIKAIFYYQGESDTLSGYYTKFHKLYNAWREDYPNVKKFYVMQIHTGCSAGTSDEMRDLERSLPDSLPNIRLMSTLGLPGHDGCHYDSNGYFELASHLFSFVAQDFYSSNDTQNIDPPAIKKAFFTTSLHNQVALLFRPLHHGMDWPQDTVVAGNLESLKDYIYLGKDSSGVADGYFSHDTLYIDLKKTTMEHTITYAPEYYRQKPHYYEGPYLINSRGIGALSFSNFPIDSFSTASVEPIVENPNSVLLFGNYPNPFASSSTIHFQLSKNDFVTLKVYDFYGREITTLLNQNESAGTYEVTFNGMGLGSGIYEYRLQVGSWGESRKMSLIK